MAEKTIRSAGVGKNQQLSVSSIFAMVFALTALGLGLFPTTNASSMLVVGAALILSSRAVLYAYSGTIYARKLPCVALFMSLVIATFCLFWPYYADEMVERLVASYQSWGGAAVTNSNPDSQPETSASSVPTSDVPRGVQPPRPPNSEVPSSSQTGAGGGGAAVKPPAPPSE